MKNLTLILLILPAFFTACSCGECPPGPPEVLSVEPAWGPAEGGTAVVITGADFQQGAVVRFGGELAAEVMWVNETTINAVTPPGTGAVSVSVENPDLRVFNLEDGFEYVGAVRCRVAAMTPDVGADQVPVVGDLRVEWSEPIDPATLEDAITLRLLGSGTVAAEVIPDGDRAAIVRPAHSLRFWSAYGLSVGDGVTNLATGEACAGAATAFATVVPTVTERALRPASINGFARIEDVVLAASADYRGLQVWDVSDPAAPVLANDVATDGSPFGIVVAGDLAYAPALGGGLIVFDVSDPVNPVELQTVGTPGTAQDVAVWQASGRTYLAIADGVEGVRLVDVTNPLGPIDLGAVDPSGARDNDTRAVAIQAGVLAIADGRFGFTLAQLADPPSGESTTFLSTFPFNGFEAVDVAWNGEALYIARNYYGVASYDVSDLSAPSEVDFDFGPPFGEARTISLALDADGNTLLAANERSGVSRFTLAGDGGITYDGSYGVEGHARAALISGDAVLIAAEEGLVVHDLATPGATPLWYDPMGHGVARAVAVVGDRAYVAASFRGLQTFDLGDPLAPELIDRDTSPASRAHDIAAFSIAAVEDAILLGDGRAGLTIYDATDPSNPVEGANLDAQDRFAGFVVADDVIYACDDNAGVTIVDVSDRGAPAVLASLYYSAIPSIDQCVDVLLVGTTLYVGGRVALRTADVSDPSSPVWTGEVIIPTRDSVRSLDIVGDHLLVGTRRPDWEGRNNQDNRLHVFDGASTGAPELVWVSEDLGAGGEITVTGDKAFVAAGDVGIFVFDLSDPAAPVLEGTIATRGSAIHVAPGATALYSASGAGGLEAIATGPLP